MPQVFRCGILDERCGWDCGMLEAQAQEGIKSNQKIIQ
jgi:hypothetical protein